MDFNFFVHNLLQTNDANVLRIANVVHEAEHGYGLEELHEDDAQYYIDQVRLVMQVLQQEIIQFQRDSGEDV